MRLFFYFSPSFLRVDESSACAQGMLVAFENALRATNYKREDERIMHSDSVVIAQEACIGCGNCSKVCVTNRIFVSGGKAKLKSSTCLECGHCYAVCPAEAISMPWYDTADCRQLGSMESLDSAQLLLGMKSRRSMRHFQDKAVEPEKLAQIIEAGRYAPTARNAQEGSYIILQERLAQAEETVVSLTRKLQRFLGIFSRTIRDQELDDHFFFKGAPLAILVLGKQEVDAALASSYMELMAESLGLGVLYSGFFVLALKRSRKLRKIVGMERGDKIVTCMVLGYPGVNYKRIAPRKKPRLKER